MLQQCPQCGHPTRAGAKFCSSCGQPIAVVAFGNDQALLVSQTRNVVRIMGFWEILTSSVRLFIRYFFKLFLASLVGYAVWALMTLVLWVAVVAPILQASDPSPVAVIFAFLFIILPIAVVNAPLTLAVSSLVLADRLSFANLVVSFFGRRLIFLLLTVALQSLLVFLGSLLLIIPGIYLAVAFSMTPATVMLEDHVGRGALQRSRDLMRGYWWKTFGLLLVSLAIPVAAFLFVIRALLPVADGGNFGALLFIGVLLVGTVAVPCFSAVVLVLLYYDLRSRRGNFSAKSLMTVPTLRLIFERI